ncbi:MAG: acetyl-CoA carboxylase biotin carboxylase subunit [Clostridia bacterium]|nr:acetyl-CoA carboxylase biotin carboxylase subunit [Clostridia bacterium]
MFKKLLVANRGEIAVRVIKGAKKLDIPVVAIYSEADAQAPHVGLADEAFLIGPPPVAQSYLQMDKIIEIARESGVDAIHPGYGLLSENAQFARKCAEAGIAFIGPSPEVITAMGDKVQARETMKKVGVPVVPGMERPVTGLEDALAAAEEIGYPVLLKAAAGGGGIGMQAVQQADELARALQLCQGRAQAYFGDNSVYLEKYFAEPRHIEIQVLGDTQGNVVHLFERECSIQRRHQKVIEEAPSPFVDPEMRARMGEVAVKAAKSLGYVGAGTMEFLVDRNKNFYFLEMNTRLQVEHPVTEMISGVDLVVEQIRIAAGESLNIPAGLSIRGHAIEGRIYAEDPQTLMPAPGPVNSLEVPEGEGIRFDCGVTAGYQVTPFYDPMIGKLVVWGEDRDQAIRRMLDVLGRIKLGGLKNNIPLLQSVISNEQFQRGEFSTVFLTKLLERGN